MTGYHLPDDSTPWFMRTCGRGSCDIRPISLAGWIVTGAYVGWTILISVALLNDGPGLAHWIAWSALLASATTLFALTMWRTSVPRSSLRESATRGRRSANGAGRRRRPAKGE